MFSDTQKPSSDSGTMVLRLIILDFLYNDRSGFYTMNTILCDMKIVHIFTTFGKYLVKCNYGEKVKQ
jgi:hypothetical protein